MKRTLIIALFVACLVGSATAAKHESRTKLWYDYPADEFIEALVMGNGQMGAIVYGGVEKETINLNEMTVWSGEPSKSTVNAAEKKKARCACLYLHFDLTSERCLDNVTILVEGSAESGIKS